MVNEGLIRVYVIADDNRWHIATKDFDIYSNFITSYVELFNTSEKCNSYRIFTIDMTRKEFETALKNMNTKYNIRPNLKLIKD